MSDEIECSWYYDQDLWFDEQGPWYYESEPDPSDYCPFCGKEYEDFSDYGCPHCDVRVLDNE
jgi:hypothetical protein